MNSIAAKSYFRMWKYLREWDFSFFGFTHLATRSRKGLDKHNTLGRERALWADAVFFKDPLPGGAKFRYLHLASDR